MKVTGKGKLKRSARSEHSSNREMCSNITSSKYLSARHYPPPVRSLLGSFNETTALRANFTSASQTSLVLAY
jgi:hypothetical protein